MNKSIHIFLDLDQTLISSEPVEKMKNHPDDKVEKFEKSSLPELYEMFHRPGLQNFLDYLFKNFTVSVWTAASKDYAVFVLKDIIMKEHPERIVEYVLFNYHCSISRKLKSGDKDLHMLWDVFKFPNTSALNTLILDDHPDVYEIQKQNCIVALPFEFARNNSEEDKYLLELQQRLDKLKEVYDKTGTVTAEIEVINRELKQV